MGARLALARLLVAACVLGALAGMSAAARPAEITVSARAVAPGAARAEPLHLTLGARAMQPGELVVATITATDPVNHVTVRAFGQDARPFAIDARTWKALIGIDLETKPGSYDVVVDAREGAASAHAVRRIVVKPKRFPTRQLRVDEAFVNPPADALARIADEARVLAALWTDSAPARLWTAPFVRPVPQPANSAFGSRSVFNGQPRAPHSGADFLSPAGTPVAAPNAGRVVLAKNLYYTGNTIVIDHGLGLFSLFAHLSRMDVETGATVERGQILGNVGATGRVTGPHLHWMVRVGNARVDPLSLVAELGTAAAAPAK